MNFKKKAIAALVAAVILAIGLIGNDLASAHQSRAGLAEKRAVAAKTAGDCTLYGSGCLDPNWVNLQHGVDGNPATADVLVIGDSIVNRCRLYLRARLASFGLTSVFDYWSGRPTTPAVDRLLSYSRIYQPDTFKAVASGNGTNDIFDPTVMTAQIARAKVIEAPLIWGTAYASRSTSYSADLRNAGWIDEQISASGLPIVDWFGFLAGYPGYRIPKYVSSDGIHPTYDVLPPTTPTLGDGSGCDAWASLYAGKINSVVNG